MDYQQASVQVCVENQDGEVLRPPRELPLEMALEFIAEDELVEITPDGIRIRKRHLKEVDRRRAVRKKA